MLRSAVQTSSLTVTLISSYFLLKSNIGLSPENIASLATTKLGYNSDIIRSLCEQRADTWIGFALLLIAFGLQMINALWPMRWNDFNVDGNGVLLGIGISALLGFIGFILSSWLSDSTTAEVNKILQSLSNR
ncbi:MAG: hypothetical protein HPY67_03910 [Syntrophaceae bacterium]|nr:hypothetical protein [Syntrophaceae bacterium]